MKNPFATLHGFIAAVVRQGELGTNDPRLAALNAAAATTFGTESTGADGGYLVPLEYTGAFFMRALSEDSLLLRCTQVPVGSNGLTLGLDAAAPWDTNGIAVHWAAEGGLLAQSKPSVRGELVSVGKITALVPVTGELLEDAAGLELYIRTAVAAKIDFAISRAILAGDGVGKPLGLLNAPGLITQAAEGGQTAGTINLANVAKLLSRHTASSRRRAVWLAHPDLEAQLTNLVVPGVGVGLGGPGYSAFNGPTDSGLPALLGIPVIFTEAANAPGSAGDIFLADLADYVAAIRTPGLDVQLSLHIWFDRDLAALRIVMRMGGQLMTPAPILSRVGGNTRSTAVTLAARP